jgi:hypothetical protein
MYNQCGILNEISNNEENIICNIYIYIFDEYFIQNGIMFTVAVTKRYEYRSCTSSLKRKCMTGKKEN